MKYTYLLALAGVAVAASAGFGQTPVPIVNPTFNADTAPTGSYTAVSGPIGTSTLTGWNVVNAGNRIIALQHPGATQSTPVAGQDATQYVEDVYLSAGGFTGATTINQVLATSFAAGYVYSLTADAAVVSSGPTAQIGDTFFIANSSGTVLASTTITGLTGSAWTQFTVPFTSTGLLGDTGAIVIGYTSPDGQPGGSGPPAVMDIDNFALTVTAVPEPGSIAIVTLGAFGLLGSLHRRRSLAMPRG
jgi:hypothetical protein